MLQLKDETERLKEAATEARQNAKRQKEHEKQWEGNRESRVAGWRDFNKKVREGHGCSPARCGMLLWQDSKKCTLQQLGLQHVMHH
jgi:hypothetical protein